MKFLKVGTIHKNHGRQYTRVEVAVHEAISSDVVIKRDELSIEFKGVIKDPVKCAECVEARFEEITGEALKVNTQANILKQFSEVK